MQERDCRACGGTGEMGQTTADGFTIGTIWRDCPVCLGSGRISDRVSREEVMVDAETLRVYQDEFRDVPAVWVAADAGAWAAAWTRAEDRTLFRPPDAGMADRAYSSAKRAARAAFRAVPALRGEEE